jgi:hypothetical protein
LEKKGFNLYRSQKLVLNGQFSTRRKFRVPVS